MLTLTGRPLRVAVLCSRRAPGLTWVLNRDPRCGTLYHVVCCLTTEGTFAEEVRVERRGIPTLSHPIRAFYRACRRPIGDLATRAAYDETTVARLAPYQPDLVILAGYLYLLTPAFLAAWPNPVLNVHLSDVGPEGRARFPGLRAVRAAVAAGEGETRATLHVVTEVLDAGPPVLRSWAFPVAAQAADAQARARIDVLHAYARAHQEWMLAAAFGPLLAAGVGLVANGRARVSARAAAIDGIAGPWELAQDGTVRPPDRPCPVAAIAAGGAS